MEDSSRPESESKPCAPARSKKPDAPLYVPKKRQGEAGGTPTNPQSRETQQTPGDKKTKPRPRYTDKARKYNKNKKDKGSGDKNTALPNGEGEQEEKEKGGKEVRDEENDETKEKEKLSTGDAGNREDVKTTGESQELAKEEEKKEEEEGEDWDSLFTEEGDCLDPHLLEEVPHFI